jgi:hypothetical protein
MSGSITETHNNVVMNENYYFDLQQEIHRFCNKVSKVYGVTIHVTTLEKIDILAKPTLQRIEEAIMNIINKEDLPEVPNKLANLNRTYSIYRQIFCKIAKDVGYKKGVIAVYLGQNHANVIYSIKTIDNLLEINDYKTSYTYKKCLYELRTKEQTIDLVAGDSESQIDT